MTMAFKLTLLLCDNMLVSSSTLAAEIFNFAAAMTAAKNHCSSDLQIRRISSDGEAVHTSSGFTIEPTHSIDEVSRNDLIHIPALWRNPRPIIKKHVRYIPFLQQQHDKSCSITAVGTGVCLLAEAGLLDGKLATTHWHYFDALKKQYPTIQLDRHHFKTEDNNIYCAASINAMAELMIHQVGKHYGHIVSQQAQRQFFHEIRNIPDSIHLNDKKHASHKDEAIADCQLWLQDNFSKSTTIKGLASKFGMTTRTFNRRFKIATGVTPNQYLTNTRMEFVCDLLQNTDLPVLEVASYAGFNDASWFSYRFRQWSGNSPKEYRQTVRAKLFQRGM